MALSVTNLGIDGVENVEQIGTGGSSRVYRARQVDLDRVVAIKVLNPGDDQGVAKRFDRERKAMGRLSLHEGIVPIYSSGITAHGEPYLVMPYYANGSLQDQIDTGAMEWETAVSYVDVAADTIAAAHDEGVVHLDLKPANILLTNTGAPRIADFGIAKLTTGVASAATTGGAAFTPAYSAPETFLDGQTGPPSDVYGLGATLWALLVGHPPFLTPGDDTNLMAVIGRVVNNPVGDLRHFTPSPICDVIERALAKKPEDRFQTARQFSQALKQAAAVSSPNFAPVDGGPAKGTILFPEVPSAPVAGAAAVAGVAGSSDTGLMTQVSPVDLPPAPATTAAPTQAAAPPRALLQETAQPLPRPINDGPDNPRGPMLDLDRFRLGPILFGVLAFVVVVGAAFFLLNQNDNRTAGEGTVATTGVASPSTTQTTVSVFSSSVTTQLDLGSSTLGLSDTTEAPSTTDGPSTTEAPSTTEDPTTTEAPSTTDPSTTDTTSSSSSATTATTVGTVGPPTNLAATVTAGDVGLSWSAAAGGAPAVGGYRVYRGAMPIATVARTVRSYTDAGLADGTYTYTVRAIGADDTESGPSNSATVTVGQLGVRISGSTFDATSVTVTFTASRQVTYSVRASTTDPDAPRVTPVSTHPGGTPVDNAIVTLLGLQPETSYSVTVIVWDAADPTVTATSDPVTITTNAAG